MSVRRTEPISPGRSPSADATSGLLQGARSSTPEPGRRSSRRERLGSSARRPCSAAAARRCVRADSPTRRIPPRRAATKTRLFFLFKQTTTISLTSPSHLRGFPSSRRVSSRRSSHTQPFGGAGSAPAFGAGSAPAFGAAPAAGAASVRAKSFFRRPRRFRSGADTSRSALDIL